MHDMGEKSFSAFLASGFPISIRLCGNVMVPGTNAGAAAIHQYPIGHQDVPRPSTPRCFGYGTDVVRAYRSCFKSGARQAGSQFLTQDLLFSLLYGGTLGASLCWVWMALDQPFNLCWIFAPLVMITMADCLENLVQAAQLRYMSPNEPSAESLWLRLADCATILKLWLTSGLYVTLAGLLLNMFCTFSERHLATDAVE
ncbi:MAG: hypothetical protein QM771_06225 [Nitrospira sp.]